MSLSTKVMTASEFRLLEWINEGVVSIKELNSGEIKVFKTCFENGRTLRTYRELTLRSNSRKKGSNRTDLRVDIQCDGLRKSIYLYKLVWMCNTRCLIPEGWEIHHIDGNPHNNRFSNLVCVHPKDHLKFHQQAED